MDTPGFTDRADAGRRLGRRLLELRIDRPIVIGMARGGVPVAAEVATRLKAPLDVAAVRKVGAPGRRELALGAVAEEGVVVADPRILQACGVSREGFADLARRERAELERGLAVYRADNAPLDLAGRAAVLVDDGIATGSSALAAAYALKRRGAASVLVAVPVCARESSAELERSDPIDAVVALLIPQDFWAVGLWYGDFAQTTDAEVVTLLARARDEHTFDPTPSV